MSNSFQLEIITPIQILTIGQINYLRSESIDNGKFGVMANHTPSIIVLGHGEIKILKDGKETFYATSGGYADIRPEGVLLLVETIEEISNIDLNRAEAALKRAQNRLNDVSDVDFERAKSSIRRARNRIKIANRL